jgi:cell wall-associated NlpC family hydrolase
MPVSPRHPLRAIIVAATLLALSAGTSAQETADRSFATAASTTVKDAATSAWRTAQEVSAAAFGLIGIRYKWGGSTPDTGLDCSGLVRYVFQRVTGVSLPRTARDMSRLGDKVAIAELKPGDLVFFNTRRFAYSHVGIYLGDNRFVHSPRRGRDVEVATLDSGFWQKRFDGARRLVGVLPDLVPTLVSEAVAAPLDLEPATPMEPDAPIEPGAPDNRS